MLQGSANNSTIGGATAGARNIIYGNGWLGVWITGSGSSGNRVQGNCVGTGPGGTESLGNVYDGIDMEDNAHDNVIGGMAVGEGNCIAHNGGAAVRVTTGIDNLISSNSIFANQCLGIDLSPSGVTVNDSGDTDDGPNHLQNFSVLTSWHTVAIIGLSPAR